eukprot:scaffold211356_cov17-Tisochrysis_lutea.AAC.1
MPLYEDVATWGISAPGRRARGTSLLMKLCRTHDAVSQQVPPTLKKSRFRNILMTCQGSLAASFSEMCHIKSRQCLASSKDSTIANIWPSGK